MSYNFQLSKKIELMNLQTKLIRKYRDEGIKIDTGDYPRAYCYVETKTIKFNYDSLFEPDEESLFDLLHEVGHIKTNTSKMKSCEREYYATVWAIKEIKKYGYMITDQRKREYQNYIWKFRETAIKHRAKVVPTKEEMTLKW